MLEQAIPTMSDLLANRTEPLSGFCSLDHCSRPRLSLLFPVPAAWYYPQPQRNSVTQKQATTARTNRCIAQLWAEGLHTATIETDAETNRQILGRTWRIVQKRGREDCRNQWCQGYHIQLQENLKLGSKVWKWLNWKSLHENDLHMLQFCDLVFMQES